MKRKQFFRNLVGFSMVPLLWRCSSTDAIDTDTVDSQRLVKIGDELLTAWQRSETMTMITVEQMPPEFFQFKYSEGAMTFAEQWRHCVVYTCGQIASNLELENPYEDVKLPVQMPKNDVVKELKNMYAFVRATIKQLSGTTGLLKDVDFAGDTVPAWRLLYAMENHIIHHRGQCVVYLRLNGVKPKGTTAGDPKNLNEIFSSKMSINKRMQLNSENKKLPVTLITGFLGSGKTTFLNHLIREQSAERILVIENEVGKCNVDGALVESGVQEVVELTAGCLCCSLSDGLLDALEVVSAKQNEIDRLVIETTGVADPSSIVQVFLADPIVERFFELEQVICVTDAGLVEDWLEETEEALRQVVMADVILLNKADTVSSSYLPILGQRMKAINPDAFILSGDNGRFPIAQILETKTKDAAAFENRLAIIGKRQDLVNGDPTVAKGNRHKVNTFTLTFDQPFVLDDYFSLQLHRLINLYREQVYRVKGVLHVLDYPNRVILQSVRTSCVVTDGTPWAPGETKESNLVFIGRGLKKEAFEQMFNRFTRKMEHDLK